MKQRRTKIKTHKTKQIKKIIGTLPEGEFRGMIVKMIQNLGNKIRATDK